MAYRIVAVVLGVIAVVYIIATFIARPTVSPPAFRPGPSRPLVIAHQGGDGLRPSNTMEAFRNAVALGADVLDMDVHLTKDGRLVVIHDQTVDRTTDGKGAVRDMTLADLKKLDAGYNWPYQGGDRPYRGKGLTIPELEEVFAAFPNQLYNIEIKQADPAAASQALCEALRKHGLTDRTLVSAFADAPMQAFRKACPEVGTAATQNEVIPFYALSSLGLTGSYGPVAQSMQVPEQFNGITVLWPAFVERAHQRGMSVYPWTINETEDMQRILEMGVDGINTDYPDRLIALLRR